MLFSFEGEFPIVFCPVRLRSLLLFFVFVCVLLVVRCCEVCLFCCPVSVFVRLILVLLVFYSYSRHPALLPVAGYTAFRPDTSERCRSLVSGIRVVRVDGC